MENITGESFDRTATNMSVVKYEIALQFEYI